LSKTNQIIPTGKFFADDPLSNCPMYSGTHTFKLFFSLSFSGHKMFFTLIYKLGYLEWVA